MMRLTLTAIYYFFDREVLPTCLYFHLQKFPILPGIIANNSITQGPLNIIPLRRIILEYRMPAVLLEAKLISPAEVVELFK